MSIYITNRTYIYSQYKPEKFEPLKPSRSGDISLLVFKISKEAVNQPCLDQKIQCLFLKYSYFLCIFWHNIFRAFSYITKCYFKIIKSGTQKIGQNRWLCAFKHCIMIYFSPCLYLRLLKKSRLHLILPIMCIF